MKSLKSVNITLTLILVVLTVILALTRVAYADAIMYAVPKLH